MKFLKQHTTAFLARFVFTLAILGIAAGLGAATTISLSTNVVVPGVKRLGLNLGYNNYYDSGQMLKELIFSNPGFEGLLYQSVIPLGPGGTASSAIEGQPFTQWPSGFWDGAAFEIIYGAAKGRTGIVTRSIAPNRANPPNDPTGSAQGTTYLFDGPGVVPGNGDQLVLRKSLPGGAHTSWNTSVAGTGSITTELADLPPGTQGRQCIRLSALNTGDSASITAANDTMGNFVLLNGSYRLSFKARGVGGANRLLVAVRRSPAGTNYTYLTQSIQLDGSWQTFQLDFTAAELVGITGPFTTQFAPVNQSAVLLDEVSLQQVNGDPANTTPWRDAVVTAIRDLNPGILRGSTFNWADSLDNHIAPPFARQRSGYTSYATNQNLLVYGLDEFFQLCAHVGAEPWYIVPITFSAREMENLVEYLAGPANSPYGARRAANGRVAPWTDSFPRIHLEFGNEAWNPTFRGGAIESSQAYGNRASELFGIAKASPWYLSDRFDLILGGQATYTARNTMIHTNSVNHDTFAVAPYMAFRVDSFANNEDLFGSLFAESEMVTRSLVATNGYMRENARIAHTTGKSVPLSIYEVNLHTTEGSISQQKLDEFLPSVGAGIGVADHMLMMLRFLECRDQCLFSLPGWRIGRTDGKNILLWSVVRDMGVTDRKRPQFLAVKLANEALAGGLIETTHTGDDPTWGVTNLNRVNINNAHYLRSYAFSNGNTRSLIVFNLHRTDALTVNFAGAEAPAGSVTLKRLSSLNITDNNEDALNVVTSTNLLSAFNPSQHLNLPPFSMNVFQWSVATPEITTGPASQTVTTGSDVTFTVVATGTEPLGYQWWKGDDEISGAIGASLTLTSVQVADAGPYRVVVSNSAGSVTSAAATLTVNAPIAPPEIIAHPQGQVVNFGATVLLSVDATGATPLSFQWRRNGHAIAGAALSTLTLTNVVRRDSGNYSVTITNTAGSVTSSNAMVRVRVAPRLHHPHWLPGGMLRLTFCDHDGGLLLSEDVAHFQIQFSKDLVNWEDLMGSLSLINGMLTLEENPGSIAGPRFYRVLER